jgi:hypothetical protein
MGGRRDVLLERDGFAAIGNPAAHRLAPESDSYHQQTMRQSNGGKPPQAEIWTCPAAHAIAARG